MSATTQSLTLQVPAGFVVPAVWHGLSPEEMAWLVEAGCRVLQEARRKVVAWNQQDVQREHQQVVQQMERAMEEEKDKARKWLEQTKDFYQKQLERMQQEVVEVRAAMVSEQRVQQQQVQHQVQQLLEAERERLRGQLEERGAQVLRITEKYEQFLALQQQQQQQHQLLQQQQNQVKTSKRLGEEGEEEAMQLMDETFRDFAGYRMERKSHQAHRGDVHLFFRDFTVLVDLKNYTGAVQRKEVEKIEHDLALNETMDFAWLISLESVVSEWNRFPVMFKWSMTEANQSKCVVIVNNLRGHPRPQEMLRSVYSVTQELHRWMKKQQTSSVEAEAEQELDRLKERDFQVVQQIRTSQKRLVEMKKGLVQMTQTVKDLETDVLQALQVLTQDRLQQELDKQAKIRQWWERQVETVSGVPQATAPGPRKMLTSTDVWGRFRKEPENQQLVATVEEFKQWLKQVVPPEEWVEKTRGGLMEFPRCQWKPLPHGGGMELQLEMSSTSGEKVTRR